MKDSKIYLIEINLQSVLLDTKHAYRDLILDISLLNIRVFVKGKQWVIAGTQNIFLFTNVQLTFSRKQFDFRSRNLMLTKVFS